MQDTSPAVRVPPSACSKWQPSQRTPAGTSRRASARRPCRRDRRRGRAAASGRRRGRWRSRSAPPRRWRGGDVLDLEVAVGALDLVVGDVRLVQHLGLVVAPRAAPAGCGRSCSARAARRRRRRRRVVAGLALHAEARHVAVVELQPVGVDDPLGTWWHSVHSAVPWPGGWSLKWHRMQVEAVTVMWLPWTICEWHDVQRRRLPRRSSLRWGPWSKSTSPNTSVPLSSRRSWHSRQAASSTSAQGLVP